LARTKGAAATSYEGVQIELSRSKTPLIDDALEDSKKVR
jgi:hypothetical protein